MDEVDIHRLANLLIRHCGGSASQFSARSAAEMKACGDLEHQRAWIRVRRVVADLTRRPFLKVESKLWH